MIKKYSFKATKHTSNNYNNSDRTNKNTRNYLDNSHLLARTSYIYKNNYKKQFIQNK